MFLTPPDLAPFADIASARAEAMIADAEAMAFTVAPCITDAAFLSDTVRVAAARAILRGAVLRWHDSGSGAVVQETAGPFSQTIDTKAVRRGMFWPSEIKQLQDLCASGPTGRQAFSVVPNPVSTGHLPWCSAMLGAAYCSCGVDIAGEPIFESG